MAFGKNENNHRDDRMVEHSPSGYNALVNYQKLDKVFDKTLMVT